VDIRAQASLFLFMAQQRRASSKTGYFIRLRSGREPHRVQKILFLLYLSLGWIEKTAERKARVKEHYTAWLDQDGRIQFAVKNPVVGVHLDTFSALIDRAWIFGDLSAEQRQREFLASYGLFTAPVASQ
jgi:hypothetical protein